MLDHSRFRWFRRSRPGKKQKAAKVERQPCFWCHTKFKVTDMLPPSKGKYCCYSCARLGKGTE
jgi:hypothetical protein